MFYTAYLIVWSNKYYNTSFSIWCVVKDYGADKISYELYATSNHIGSLYAGHYTANIKHFASQKWFTCNDSRYGKFPSWLFSSVLLGPGIERFQEC